MVLKQGRALVVGAGISGIRSALDLAETGCDVTLIDAAPHMGGMLTKLEHQFPTDGCGMCRMLPMADRDSCFQGCLRKGLVHEAVDIMLSTRLVKIDGEPGSYRVTLETEPSIVDPELCTGCNRCSEVCPVTIRDPFNLGLSETKAIYLPVPQAIPNIYTVDMDHCTLCGECEKICPFNAIKLPEDDKKKFRILVVDDELIMRESLKEWLLFEGYGVETAASGDEALEMVENSHFSMVFLDIKMPGMDGTEVLSRVKEKFNDLVVVMMTAYATVETAVETMRTGAHEYVIKPFDPQELLSIVKKIYLAEKPEARTFVELDVGAVILATGVDYYNPLSGINTFGYKKYPDVITNIELERILSRTGPFQGELKCLSDGRVPRRMAWIQCVGSRTVQFPVCSSVCCMIALKEAVLVRQRSGKTIETIIYYMDMRCFGKEFEAYRNRAENEYGVILRRARPHSVCPEPGQGLSIQIIDDSGKRKNEIFDMVVLSLGQRPSRDMEELSKTTKTALNEFGYLEAPFLEENRKIGVFPGGSASGLKDIGESVIFSSSASAMALGVIHGSAPPYPGAKEESTLFRDVSSEIPDIGVVLCQCPNGPDIEQRVRDILEMDIHVSKLITKDRICTKEGWDELLELVSKTRFNRLLILACDSNLFLGKKVELGRAMKLDPAYIEFIDLYKGEPVGPRVKMGLARIRRLARINSKKVPMVPKVLVVGGGIAGMTAAMTVAESGFEAVIVEKNSQLGGNLAWLHKNINNLDFGLFLKKSLELVQKNPAVTSSTSAAVVSSKGRAGNYTTIIKTGANELITVEHGAVIFATGGTEARTISHGYGKNRAIITNRELEQALKTEKINPAAMETVVMILCVDSRIDTRKYCSRVCCRSSLKHALEMKRLNPELGIYVLYRDMVSYGFSEAYFKEARQLGVLFIPYTLEDKPEISFESDRPIVRFHEPIIDRPMEILSDLVVLAAGIVPWDMEHLARIFHAEVDSYSFFSEADSKWRPVDSMTGGVFACGLALGPRDVEESVATARAAAMGAIRLISKRGASNSLVTAGIKPSLCTLCERCIDACAFGARTIDPDDSIIRIDPLACQGCGSCAAVCTSSAAYLNNFLDQQMFEIIDAAI